jgi:hypothetical protein
MRPLVWIVAHCSAALHQLWSLTFREAQTQAFADAFLAIMAGRSVQWGQVVGVAGERVALFIR